MKTSKIMLMPFFFFQCCWNKGKMSLSFTRSAASSMGSKSMETLCFSQSPASGPHRYDPLCFSVHGAGVMFYRAWRWCHFCVRWALLSCFPALVIGSWFPSLMTNNTIFFDFWLVVIPKLRLEIFYPIRKRKKQRILTSMTQFKSAT